MWRFESERRRPAQSEQLAEPSAAQERRETGRLEALSDGVFAIAMTLLILNVRIPARDETLSSGRLLYDSLLDGYRWLSLVTYVLSFVTVLVMWINHHYLFQFVARIDRFFVLVNGLLLLLVVFVNYPTALVANFVGTKGGEYAAAAYNATFVLVALCYNAMWFRIVGHRRLLVADADPEEVASFTRQYIFGGPLYLVALALAFVNPGLSIALDAALALYFAFTGRIIRKQLRRPAQPVEQPEQQAERQPEH
jgi:uncharacterized membrane protein